MAHTYVIQSVKQIPGGSDPQVQITGTVDGVPVAPTCWLSIYQANGATALAAQNFIIGLMLQAWTALQTSVPANAPPGGTTVTQ